MCAPHSWPTSAMIITCYFLMGPSSYVSCQKKTSCYVQGGRADCSHLSLSEVPQNLPRNLTSLDMSHNRLARIPPESLAPYPGLLHLNISFNSIKKLDGGLCKTLNLLQTLDVGHNQVLSVRIEDFSHCTVLTHLILAQNRLKLIGEPFSALKVQI